MLCKSVQVLNNTTKLKNMAGVTVVYCRAPFLRLQILWILWIFGTSMKIISLKVSGNSIVTWIADWREDYLFRNLYRYHAWRSPNVSYFWSTDKWLAHNWMTSLHAYLNYSRHKLAFSINSSYLSVHHVQVNLYCKEWCQVL